MRISDVNEEMKLLYPKEMALWVMGTPPYWFWDSEDGKALAASFRKDPQLRVFKSSLVAQLGEKHHMRGFAIVALLRWLLGS